MTLPHNAIASHAAAYGGRITGNSANTEGH